MEKKYVDILIKTAVFLSLPLLVLGWSSVPGLSGFTIHMALFLAMVAFALVFMKRDTAIFPRTILHTLIILFLVAGTGWFLSPFFFLLYLLPMYLGFLYVPVVAFGFLTAILVIFAFSVGEVNVAFDVMTLLSLLLVVPLIIYLRKKYLILRQTTKDILILQDESGIKDASTITRLLSNKVTSLGVNVRQPLTFIKQASTMLLQDTLEAKEATRQLQRIRTTAAETLEMIRAFEGDTSANRVLRNKSEKTIKKPA